METFLFILAIVLPLCLLIAVYRLNTLLINIQRDSGTSFFNDKPLLLLNNGGKWLTLFGCAATLPLVLGLIFDAENSVKWIVNLGVAGCLTMIGSASLLIPALLGFAITRHIQFKLLISAIGRVILKDVRHLIRNKVVLWWFAGALLIALILFAPIFQHLANGVVYLIGFILVARIGLVDKIEQDFEAKWGGSAYNYATGKWDDGYQEGGLY
ncbi:MAG: hypothetical protein M0R33_16440 [Methylomonas sp.]|jgi:hypothetical protein|uniref:hypothetical protein n=1 Tax=Methylomonas sp. TaxID=418 RepID=UPI0025E2977A|nr:hypothetical protein [Methylomonas sp.]MCK9608032.1 hypothetical protein [Methylomonas sp.]